MGKMNTEIHREKKKAKRKIKHKTTESDMKLVFAVFSIG